MAIANVQRVVKGANTTALAISSGDGWSPPTTGNLIVVSANSDSTVAISGSGWTTGPSVVDGNGAYTWWKASNGTETTITCSPTGSAEITATACEYSGASLPVDASNSSTIASSAGFVTTAASVTTTASADLIVAYALLHGTGGGVPASPSWSNSFVNVLTGKSTTALTSAVTYTFMGELLPAGAAGSYSTVCTWITQAMGDRQHIILAFKASAGAPALPPILVMPPRR
jgi:hypothetical protein